MADGIGIGIEFGIGIGIGMGFGSGIGSESDIAALRGLGHDDDDVVDSESRRLRPQCHSERVQSERRRQCPRRFRFEHFCIFHDELSLRLLSGRRLSAFGHFVYFPFLGVATVCGLGARSRSVLAAQCFECFLFF